MKVGTEMRNGTSLSNVEHRTSDSLTWSDKYKPTTLGEMCYPSCAEKLKAWLQGFQPADVSDSKEPRAVLCSGPPGVGKTTSVYVVAKELGKTVVEYNASNFRSQKSLKENVSDLISNRAFSSDMKSYTSIILLMDEVDGCDRGGVGEIIAMIKETQIPIICTCNDRWHPKLRSLINWVYDLRFSCPPCHIVANYLCNQVLSREGISLSKPLLQEIIKRSRSDIRNMLNNLQLWCLKRKSIDQTSLAECAKTSLKNGDLGLFNAAEIFLLQGTSRGERKTIAELQDIYYNSDLVDAFVQENYLHFNPESTENRDWMSSVSSAADCISLADNAQRIMYYEQNWSVSRSYTILSSIAPCVYTRGKYMSFLSGQQEFFDRQRPVKFPTLIGHGSTAKKNLRLLRCLWAQAATKKMGVSGNQGDVVQDYIPLAFERSLTQPLIEKGNEGIDDVISFMDHYKITRDDWDLVQLLPHYKHMKSTKSISTSEASPASPIPSAVKSAFTRRYNKAHVLESLAKDIIKKTPSTMKSLEDDDTSEEDEESLMKPSDAKEAKAKPSTRSRKGPAKAPKEKGKASDEVAPKAAKAPRKKTAKRKRDSDSCSSTSS